jgi:ABC-type glycerol-3-phosphate transport system substrate-binding protein
MWSPLTGPDGAIMTQLTSRFNQENPQKIQVQHVAQPEYLQKLNNAAAAGNLPEMTVIRASDTAEMAARNVVKPISDETLAIMGGSNIAAEASAMPFRLMSIRSCCTTTRICFSRPESLFQPTDR